MKWVRQINSVDQINFVLNEVAQAVEKGLKNGVTAILTISRPNRSLEQNRLMWPLLEDFSKQVDHFGNKYKPEDWKDLLTASFEGCTRYAPSLDGKSMVAFGVRTSKWPKDTFSNFIEFVYSEGVERGVQWSKQSQDNYEEVKD